MSKPIVVLISWDNEKPTQMASFAHGVAQNIANNATTFPTPPVTPQNLDIAANRVELAYANRLNGPVAKTELQTADNALDVLLHQMAAYVNTVANGNASIIQIAGFKASSNQRLPATVPATPDAPKISGNAAALHLETNKVNGAVSYCWLIFTGEPASASITADCIILPAAAVIIIPDGHLREDLHNIIPAGTKISVQVLAQNAAGKSGFSPLISFTVGG
ncbi:MAG: hypothetical protein ABJB05_12740 [Parafilimonas sp.]